MSSRAAGPTAGCEQHPCGPWHAVLCCCSELNLDADQVPSPNCFEMLLLNRHCPAHAAQVNTLNVEGKKKRGKYGFFRRPDYKKAFVVLKEQQPGSGVQPQ